MPYNGSGTFSPYTPGNPRVAGTTIAVAAINATNTDIATGLSNAVTRDGQSPATANLPMGGFRHTGASNGVASTDYATVGQSMLVSGANAFVGGSGALRGSVDNAVDLGTTALRWRSLYAGTSVVFQGATFATTVTAAPTANRAIALPDAAGTLALQSPCIVIAYLTQATQSIAQITTYMIGTGASTYTEVIDTASALDAVTGVFTVPATGVYAVSFSAGLLRTATDTTNFYSYFGNSAGTSIDVVGSSTVSVAGTSNAAIYSSGSGLVSLTAGATYGLWAWHENSAAANRSLIGAVQGSTMLTITRVI
ncbi:hypothetical protein UFOVP1165_44 [uncultured Caudovirales phage]|uniref:C1q domain containing protein n=1 Tax=uncultured Caudovirales phage TaxID=2100421 RepID=A0A6J5R3L1_9CAUD|nr:hypothetical protein UFOVP1165_44 [uncultured Caudovirales phage]